MEKSCNAAPYSVHTGVVCTVQERTSSVQVCQQHVLTHTGIP